MASFTQSLTVDVSGGTTWYVSSSGSDSLGSGSASAPFATILKASQNARPGDTVMVEAGDYIGGFTTIASGTADAPITYKSQTKWGARIVAASNNPSRTPAWTNGGSGSDGSVGANVIIDGFHIDGTTLTSGTQYQIGIYCTGNNNTVQNCKVHDLSIADPNGGAGIEIDGYYGCSGGAILRNEIYNILPAGGTTPSLVHGVYMSGNGCLCADNLIINDDITSWHGANALDIINNTLIGGIGILIGSGDVSDSNAGGGHYYTGGIDNCRVFNNIVYKGTAYGIEEEADSSTGGLIGPNNQYSNNLCFQCASGPTLMVHGSPIDTLTSDPLFVNPTMDATGDYHLTASSPALNAGIATLGNVNAPTIGLDGQTRPIGIFDLGCYEGVLTATPANMTFVSSTANSLTVQWTWNGTPDAWGIFTSLNKAQAVQYNATQPTTTDNKTWTLTITGLTAGNYIVSVEVFTSAGGWSAFHFNSLPYGVGANNVPNATDFFVYSPTATTVNVEWTPPAGTGTPNTYHLQYRRLCDFTWTDGITKQWAGTALVAFTQDGLQANTAYSFRLQTNGSRFSHILSLSTSQNGATDSPDGMSIIHCKQQGNDMLVGSDGTQYQLNETATPYQLLVNGTADTGTASGLIIQLIYSAKRIYIQNTNYKWFSKVHASDAWQAANDPRVGSPGHGSGLPSSYDTRTTPSNVCMLYGGAPVVDNMKVHLIFWGTYWNQSLAGTQAEPTAGQIETGVNTIYQGPYFPGMREYFVTQRPSIVEGFIVGSDPPNFAGLDLRSQADPLVQQFITTLINNGTIQAPDIDNHMIFFVLPNGAGFPNGTGGYHSAMLVDGCPVQYGCCFYQPNLSNTLDVMTGDIVHETVECMTNPWNTTTFTGAAGWSGPGETSTLTQIDAVEVEDFNNPEDRLSNVGVFGFYSNRARAVIVPTSGVIPSYDHIVVCIMENHAEDQIIGSSSAPYINSLCSQGMLLTNFFAITHPSEPNYFALYAGDTFGITDDGDYSEPDPSLYTALNAAGKSFRGFIESASPRKHNPWESFPEGTSVESDLSQWPSDFTQLPNVAFVIPDLNDDMHDGTVQQGDTWLQNNLDSYIQWAKTNNSLFILTFDEDDNTTTNQITTILVGSGVKVNATNATQLNHYSTLRTICNVMGATAPRNGASATL